MKKHNILKKGMAMALSLAMVIGLDPSFAWNLTTVHATEASSEPGVSAYAAKEQLMDGTFAPDADGNATNIGKIKLGKNSDGNVQEWYVLGRDTGVDGENTAIFAASPIAAGVTFGDSGDNNKTYKDTFGAYADSSTPNEVYPNHYGASGLRAKLNEMVADNTTYFTTVEKSLIQPTTVSTKDTLNSASYTTTDILYALHVDYHYDGSGGDKVLYAGSNNGKALSVNTYWNTGDIFWLREPFKAITNYVFMAKPGYSIIIDPSDSTYAVRPASNLNLSSVIFASAATEASSETVKAETIQTDTAMTLRLDGKDKNIGTITYNSSEGTVKATKGTVTSASIVVQGNNAGTDWYYSKQISGNDDAVKTDEIKAKISERVSAISDASDIDLKNCRIWLETTDADGMIYAVNATEEKVEPTEETKTLNISDGAIKITPTGYTQNGGDEIAFTGKYIITGSVECDTPLSFSNETDEAVEYDVTFDNAHILGSEWCSAITFKDGSKSDITVNITNKGTSEVRAWGGASFQNQISGNAKVTVNITEEEGSSLYLGPRDENQGDTTHRIYSSDIDCKVNGKVPANEKTFKSGTYAQTEPETPGEDATKKSIGLGTSIIANPTVPTSKTDAWKGSYVYFGTNGYNDDNTLKSVKYRVLDNNTTVFGVTTMLLDCDSVLETYKFDNDGSPNDGYSKANDWAGSDIKSHLNGFWGRALFYTAEYSAIAESTKNEADGTDGSGGNELEFTSLSGDKMFLLDAKEATNTSYGYFNTYSKAESRRKKGCNSFWWMRSARANNNDIQAGCVGNDGSIGDRSVNESKDQVGISPAFNINLSSILFSSVISGTAGETGAEYKLTLIDDSTTMAADGNITRKGDTITVPYTITEGEGGAVTKASVLILDKQYTPGNTNNANILAYDTLDTNDVNFETTSTGTFKLPAELSEKECGKDYYAYIIAECDKSDKLTNYASAPVSISVPDKPWEAPEVKAISFGTPGITNPAVGKSTDKPWTGSYVYFGTYNGSPIKYRVLDSDTTTFSKDNNTKTMLLDCDSLLFYSKFDDNSNEWSTSYLKRYLNSEKGEGYDYSSEGFLTTAFTSSEQSAIASSTKISVDSSDGNEGICSCFKWTTLNDDKIFLLDVKEACNTSYGYSKDDSAIINRQKTGNNNDTTSWWLRSAAIIGFDLIGIVDDGLFDLVNRVPSEKVYVSPDLNVNLSSILLSSATGVGKTSAITKDSDQINTIASNEWKLTLKDAGKTVNVTKNKAVTKSADGVITVPYTYTDTATTDAEKANQISVMITDKAYTESDAQILYYGALQTDSINSGSGKGTFELPNGLDGKTLGSDYHVYILAEHVNNTNATDYASEPVEITNIYNAINRVEATINQPKGGKPLSTAIECTTEEVEKAQLYWTDTTNNNVDTTANYYPWTYKAHLSFTPKSGYTFTDATEIAVNGWGLGNEKSVNEDGTLTVTGDFESSRDKLLSITAPAPITVANGTAYADMNLPSQVEITTEDRAFTKLGVTWNTDSPFSGSYDPSKMEEQKITLRGTVNHPEEIDFGTIEPTTQIEVTISAAETVNAPTADVAAGTYSSNQTVTLASSTDGATIYYTTDGTVPSIGDNGKPSGTTKKYSDAISVTGTQGLTNSTTIKAIAVKSGMYPSAMSEFVYTIAIPHEHSFENAKWKHDGTKHWKECTNANCDKSEGYISYEAKHSGGTASYFKKAVCSNCGAEYGEPATDTILPTGEIKVKDNIWNSFLNTITFGKYFKETQKVTIAGTDDSYKADGFDSSKNVKVSYLLVSGSDAKAYTTEALAVKYSAKEFKEYTESFNINPEDKYVVFARIEDHAGNVTFVSSDGMIVDATAPTVNRLENNKTYCGDVKFTVTDEHLDKVTDTIGEETKTLEAVDGEYTLSAGTHKITATDKVGNKTEVNVTVNAGHTYGDTSYKWNDDYSKCTAERTCSVCKQKETETVKSVSNIKQQKSCTLPEITAYTATFANKAFTSQTKDIKTAEAGHSWNDDYTVDTPATCTAKGSKSIHCKNCDEVKDSTAIDALGHDFTGEWKVTKKATCTEPGTKERKCSRCDEAETDTIPATGHTEVEDAAVAATCTTAGKTAGSHCSVCNAVIKAQEEIPAAGHTEVEDAAVAATCTTAGKTAGSHCSVCNAVIKAQEEIPAAGHSFGEWEKVKSSTCNDKGSQKRACKVCGYTETKDVDANGHTWEKDYTVDKEPTCTTEGSKSIHCKNCDEVKDSAVIKALGHDFTGKWKVTKKATCTETGTKIRKCSRCDEIETEIIPATGHTEVEDAAVAATCTTAGKTAGSHCSVCNAVIKAQEEIPAAGHSFGEWEKVKSSTCNDKGSQKRACKVCGYTETKDVDANGHTWEKDYTVDKKPTCTAEGSKSIHCKNCDEVKDSAVIDALGHDFTGEWKVTKKATCTELGTKTRKCSRCDEVETEIIPATGHTEVEDAAIAATCTTAGKTAGSHCSVCKAVIKAQEEIPAAGHSFGEWETVKSSTCNDKGSQKRACKVCGYTETKDVDANGHAWEKDYTVDKEPTCTAEGSKSIHCKNCDEVKDSAVIDALGHDFTGKWKVTKKATCTEPGTKTRKCSRCDEAETDTIPATGHTEVEDVAVAATCTTAGKTAGSHCSVCNAVIKAQEEIPAAGHSWSEWISDGKQEKSTCSVCGQKKYRNTDDGDDTGKIDKEAEVTPDSPFGGASLDTNKEDLIAAKGIFTPEEKAEVENGVNARIWVEISSTENITEENRQKIEALAKKLMGSDISNLTYFDAELFKSVTKDGVSTKSQINEPGAHIEISLRLPESLVSKDRFSLRKYKVIRLHDGKVDSLDAEFDKETNTLKFVTDRFSTYAIAYTDNALASCVTLTPDSKTLTGKGETVQLIATVTPDNAVNKKLTWSTSDSSVAAVDENGLVTAVANGTAIITVTTEDGEMTATSTITVNIPSDDNSNKGNNNKPNSKPNTNSVILTDNKKHDNQKVISSKTGDTSDVTLWTTVFAAALAGIIGIFARRKKEQQ